MPDFNQNGNGTNNSNGQYSVRSYGLNLFGADGNMLMISYLDDSISVAFCYPESDGNGKKTYPKQNRITTTIRRDAVADFAHILNEDAFLDAVTNKGHFVKGIFLNRQLTEIMSITVEGDVVGLHYFKDLDENNMPKSAYTFVFQKTTIITGYDGTSDKYTLESSNASLYMFIHLVTWFEATCATKIGAHMAKLGSSWNMTKELEYLRAIADKVGAHIASGSNYNNGSSTAYPLPFGSTNPSHTSTDDTQIAAQMTQVNSLAGFIQ